MNIENYFEEVKGITVDAARNCGARYTAIDICRFAKNYHERELKILNLDFVSKNEAVCEVSVCDYCKKLLTNEDFDNEECLDCGETC